MNPLHTKDSEGKFISESEVLINQLDQTTLKREFMDCV